MRAAQWAATVAAFALQTACLTPVDEDASVDAGGIETLFVVPIDPSEMGTLGYRFWAYPPADTFAYGGLLPPGSIFMGKDGELLIDHLGGAIRVDGTFVAPPEDWRAQAFFGLKHQTDGWHRQGDALYRTTCVANSSDVTFWRFEPSTQTIVRDSSIPTGVDGGQWGAFVSVRSTHKSDAGADFCIGAHDPRAYPRDGGVVPGFLRLYDFPGDMNPRVLSATEWAVCEGSAVYEDGVAYLVRHNQLDWSILRKTERTVETEAVHASSCMTPRRPATPGLHYICQEENRLNHWLADRNSSHTIDTIQLPEGTQAVAFLREHPFLYLRVKRELSIHSNDLEICGLRSCSEPIVVNRWPPAIEIIDSDLVVADYIADAGVRVRKLSFKIWNQP